MTNQEDELQAAVSARASRKKTQEYSYSDDFSEEEDDFLNALLKSRKQRTDAFKAGRSKAKINDFELSDDEGKHGRTKKVSFLKSQSISLPLEDTTASESHETEPPDNSVSRHNTYNKSFFSQHSTNVSQDNMPYESTDPEITRDSSSKSLSFQTSDDTFMDIPLPLPSDSSVVETPGPDDKRKSVLEESSQALNASEADLKHVSLADNATESGPPRPKPRQRTLGLSLQEAENLPEETESQDLSRPQTTSASIPVSINTSSNISWTEGDHAFSYSLSRSSSNKSEQSQLLIKSTADSGSRDDCISGDSKEQETKYSTSFEEFNDDLKDHSNHSAAHLSHGQRKSLDTRTSSSQSKTTQGSQSGFSKKVESKYLGTLKVLDNKVSLQNIQTQAADSLRAAIYQEWLKKKKEKSRETMQVQKEEEILKEKKKREEEAKKEEAVASYEAWKEKKVESLKAKAKEQQDTIRKAQKAIEEKEEKRQSAKLVFEKWKHEHDHLHKEKYRKQQEAGNKLKLKKKEKEEERKRESSSAFSNWCEKKKVVQHERITVERKEIRNKTEEERYMKEERDKMALEMYENWVARKDLEQKRQREERQIQAILQDSPRPPWSPPNKTVPFGK
ncbi:microtubule-associated protein 9 isoform X2 [Mastacembelus armatus]|uniref:microtubule-associated protein 9 isoform X2 n=1 Tax=Mastacembelus armatus TaxID=205130 RepID=UPI000E456D13|nr:microtubule-associated protein 9 isoform X2 [Mastacembelus armatus]